MAYALKKNKLSTFIFFFIFSTLTIIAQDEKNDPFLFRFKLVENDAYKIHSVVNEIVYLNGIFHHEAKIINRITVSVSDVKQAQNEIGSALYSCEFMTSEQNNNRTFSWARNYTSVFRRDELGKYTIEDKYFMPIVRDVPIFTEQAVKPMDKWKSNGKEAHDFRDTFGIEKPFIVPFEVEYQYIGLKKIDDKMYRHITATYNLNYTVPQNILQKYNLKNDIPIKTIGKSKQNLYWDEEKGNLYCYDEEFNIKFVLYSGNTFDFKGTAHAKVIETKQPDITTEEKLKENIENLKLENTKVKKTKDGLTISLEKIRFMPNSAILLQSEKNKLNKIAEVLKSLDNKEFLISGHTAFAGTEAERQQLSEERASTVANYLIELGVQTREHIYTQGLGATEPIAPNTSPENMSKNRRVEITILEK